MQHMDSIVSSEMKFVRLTGEEGGIPAVEDSEGILSSFTSDQQNLNVPPDDFRDVNNFLDLPVSLLCGTEVLLEQTSIQNEVLWAIEPMSSYFGDMNPAFDLALLEQRQDKIIV